MVLAALAADDDALKASQYQVLDLWQRTYEGALRIMLPDTFGTTQFLAGAPNWVADWTGQRIDSKNPYIAGDEYIEWLKAHGREPQDKLIIASDALDVDDILGLHAYLAEYCKQARAAGTSAVLPIFMMRKSGLRAAGFGSAPAGVLCSQTISAAAIPAAAADLIPLV